MEFNKFVRKLQFGIDNSFCLLKIRDGKEHTVDIQKILSILQKDCPVFSILYTTDANTMLTVSSPLLYCKMNTLSHLNSIILLNDEFLSKLDKTGEMVYLYIIDLDSFKNGIPDSVMDLYQRPRVRTGVFFLTSRERWEFAKEIPFEVV